MSHPFDLNISDLEAIVDFAEQLTDEEAATIGGGSLSDVATTQALGEEGGRVKPPVKYPPREYPPIYTTLAIGEEGGDVTV